VGSEVELLDDAGERELLAFCSVAPVVGSVDSVNRVAGHLWFGCGRAVDERPLWREMLGRRFVTRIVYWPFALPAAMLAGADEWLRGAWDVLGVRYDLQTWTGLEGRSPTELSVENVDLLFVGGGNTFRLLDTVRAGGFLDPAREFWRSGGDYYGGSAGAILACEDIRVAKGVDPNDLGLTDLTGLGLLVGVQVLPHYTDDQYEDALRRAVTGTVIAVPESIGLHCAGGVATVLGAGELSLFERGQVTRFTPGEYFPVALLDGRPLTGS